MSRCIIRFSPVLRSFPVHKPFTLRLDDINVCFDQGFGEQGREVGHDLFERLLFRRVEHNIGKAHQFIEIDTRLTIQFR